MKLTLSSGVVPAVFSLMCSFSSTGAFAQESIRRNDMVDYDQRRSGLVDDGAYYCVPTSCVDMFKYMDNHGLPSMNGSFSNSYADITAWILYMGVLMGTNSADKGTGGTAAFNVSNTWIDNHTTKFFSSVAFGPGSDWSWRTIRNNMRLGALVRIGRGKYVRDTVNNEWDRDGGHAVMVAGFLDDGSGNRQFLVADPNNNSSLTTQEPFSLDSKPTSDITFTTEKHGLVTHARYTLSTGSNGNTRWVIDSMNAVLPFVAGWTTTTQDSQGFTFKVPFQFNEATAAWPTTFTFTTSDNVQDWCFDMMKGGIIYLASTGKIYEYDPFDGTKTQLADLPTAKKIAIGGPRQDLYVVTQGALTDELRYVPRKGAIGVIKSLNTRVDALDYDPVMGGPVVTKFGSNKFIRFSRTLGTRFDETTLSLSLIPPASVGPTIFKVDEHNGDYLLSNEGSTVWSRFRRHGNRRVEAQYTVASTAGLKSLCALPHGQALLQIGSRLVAVNQQGLETASDFDGITAASPFRSIRREFAALDSDISGPDWYDQTPGPDEP